MGRHSKYLDRPLTMLERGYLYYRQQKARAFELLGAACKRCNFADWRALQIDHIDGSGYKERKGKKTGNSVVLYNRIIKGSKDYQLLCANCNWIKRNENKETRWHGADVDYTYLLNIKQEKNSK